MVFGTIFIAGGAVLIAIFGIVPEPTHSLEDLLVLFGRPAFIAYFSLLGAAVLACLVIVRVALNEVRVSTDSSADTHHGIRPSSIITFSSNDAN